MKKFFVCLALMSLCGLGCAPAASTPTDSATENVQTDAADQGSTTREAPATGTEGEEAAATTGEEGA